MGDIGLGVHCDQVEAGGSTNSCPSPESNLKPVLNGAFPDFPLDMSLSLLSSISLSPFDVDYILAAAMASIL